MPKQAGTIQGIQILRAVAAVAVAAGHSQYGQAARTTTDFFTWDHMAEGGVDLFFIISGFIMMLVSDPLTGRETARSTFLIRRVQRVVPLYWFFNLLLAAGAVAMPSLLRWTTISPELVLTSMFFIPAFHPVNGGVQPLISVGWTLQYEAFFYVVFACLLPLGLGARVVVAAALFTGLVSVAGLAGRGSALAVFLANPIMFEFVAGMAVYWLYRRGGVTRQAGAVVAVLALPVAFWAVGSGVASPLGALIDPRWHRAIAWGVPALLLFYSGLALFDIPGMAGRALVKLGDASYSLYLSHVFVAAAAGKLWAHMGHQTSAAFGLLLVLPCCIVAALLCHRFIERPLGAAVRRSRETRAEA